MRAGPMIVATERTQVIVEAPFIEYDHMIQTLTADRANDSFDICSCHGDRGAALTSV
jgi:hypothetical protein